MTSVTTVSVLVESWLESPEYHYLPPSLSSTCQPLLFTELDPRICNYWLWSCSTQKTRRSPVYRIRDWTMLQGIAKEMAGRSAQSHPISQWSYGKVIVSPVSAVALKSRAVKNNYAYPRILSESIYYFPIWESHCCTCTTTQKNISVSNDLFNNYQRSS